MSVIQTMKEVLSLLKKYDDVPLMRKIVELEQEVLDLSQEVIKSRQRIQELKKTLEFSGQLVFHNCAYWREGDMIPYCSGCFEGNKIPVHMVEGPEVSTWMCPACRMIMQRMEPPEIALKKP